jgi:hypothetical protein
VIFPMLKSSSILGILGIMTHIILNIGDNNHLFPII